MSFQTVLTSLILTLISGLGGYAASFVHIPLPFMTGSLIVAGLIALFLPKKLPQGYAFPTSIRAVFMVAIGVMIGTKVTPDLLNSLGTVAASLAGLTVFVFLAHGANYLIFRHIGRYDRPTAFYAGTPGGLLESLAMGEAAGANLPILTMQQFLRIIAVITLMPVGLSFWYGAPLGSASGISLGGNDVPWQQIPLAIGIGLVGYIVGLKIKLPAGQLTGPLLAAALVSVFGWADLALPQWLINLSQVVIGTSLGLKFTGLRGQTMVRAAWLSVLSVTAMLGIGIGFSLGLQWLTGTNFDVLLISFAPGGVTEMALIALSLHANPALVTLHHVFRIFLTVIEMTLLARLFKMNKL